MVGLVERCISLPACLPSNTLTRTPTLPLSQASRSSLKSFHTFATAVVHQFLASQVTSSGREGRREGRERRKETKEGRKEEGRKEGRKEGNLPFFGIML